MLTIRLEGLVKLHHENVGQALIAENIELVPGLDDGLFVRLQSWSQERVHPVLEGLRGKRVRITIETIE